MVESSPSISREQWTHHPHWPEQVLLLGSHANFCRISTYLVEQAETGRGAGEGLAMIASLYLRWIAGMRGHEAYEENKLYPYLAARWAISLAAAEAGHDSLHERHATVVDAIASAAEAGVIGEDLVEALRAHDRALREHLEIEEAIVIPHLLALEPEEFRRYANRSIEALLAELGA